jgi:dTDP-D-glucose 4,6-dehydratase
LFRGHPLERGTAGKDSRLAGRDLPARRAKPASLHGSLCSRRVGEVYNIGGRCEKTNLELTHTLLEVMGKPKSLIRSVADRLGHDRRYAIDCSKIERELGWRPTVPFDGGLRATVEWYRSHADWVAAIRSGEYRKQAPAAGRPF